MCVLYNEAIKEFRGGKHMKLELANYLVKDVVFGDRTYFKGGTLTISKEEAIDRF